METTIFNEFRHLTDSADLLKAIDLLESGLIPENEARHLAEQVWQCLIPKCPPGRRHIKESFWAQGSAKMVWRGLIGKNAESKAVWMRQQRMLGRHNSTNLFVPIYTPPTVRTGKF